METWGQRGCRREGPRPGWTVGRMEPTWGPGVCGARWGDLDLKSVPPAEVLVQPWCWGRGHPVTGPHPCPCRPRRPQPLWRKVLSTAALGAPLLLGARYLTAGAQERRRMRLVVDGVGRFSR